MNKLELENDINNGLSTYQLSKKYNKSQTNIRRWLKIFNLKTQYSAFKLGLIPRRPQNYRHNNKSKYDWNEIQSYYDAGHTWREISSYFGAGQSVIFNAIRSGRFKSTRNTSAANKLSRKNGRGLKKHSEETKKKISEIRIKYLTEHPDKVPYLINHSSKKSYPEQVFENALIASNITGWTYAFRNGIYEYDFAFVDKKIDVEVDGGTHTSEKVKKIDARRDIFSKSQGWTVVRFTAKEVKANVIKCIEELKKYL